MILAIDQGTTGTTCLVFDAAGTVAGRAYSEFQQFFPRPGWVEHDAGEIWEVTRRVAAEAIADAGIEGAGLDAIGITNQRETVVAWDPETGEPVHRALVWQDRRTAALPKSLNRNGYLKRIILDLRREFVYRGRTRSYLSAACAAPAGTRIGIFPFVRVSMTFADGRKLASSLIRTCRVRE